LRHLCERIRALVVHAVAAEIEREQRRAVGGGVAQRLQAGALVDRDQLVLYQLCPMRDTWCQSAVAWREIVRNRNNE
jgi:hypothetical protein